MNRYIAEVIAAHVAIENWLNQGEGSADALMRRFSPDFTMIPINGMRMDHQAVSAFFHGARASRPGLKIVVDSAVILAEWRDGAAVSYREIHALVDGSFPSAGRENHLAAPPRDGDRVSDGGPNKKKAQSND